MIKSFKYLLPIVVLFSCNDSKEKEPPKPEKISEIVEVQAPILHLEEADNLAGLPLNCVQVEYPNKLNQTIGSSADLKTPKTLHPAFYGCFDWHSSVHGHWSLVSLLKQFPELTKKREIEQMLLQNMSADNIQREVDYFYMKHNSSYERTYGWAWLLK